MENNATPRRTALVAGGSGDIGRVVSERLALNGGHAVFIGYHTHSSEAETCAESIRAKNGIATAVELDIRNSANVNSVCERLKSETGRFDILVNCSAINRESPLPGMTDDDWSAVIETNLTGAFYLCRAASKYMMLNRYGRIVNVSSVSASFGGRGQANYSAAKAGLESLTRVLALELGRKGIRANCVALGVIETKMSQRIRDELQDRILPLIAIHRFGQPDDVADIVGFLASEASDYITGQVIRADGGLGL